MKVADLLGMETGFTSFMFHLSREFSIEILLSLIELYQYKQYICDYRPDDCFSPLQPLIEDTEVVLKRANTVKNLSVS